MSATEYPLYSLPEGKLKSFSIKTMEEIEDGRAKKPEGKLPHSHDFYTIIWIKKGKGIHRVDFKDYPIAHNQLFFLHPGQVHSLQIEEESGYVCMFTLDFMCATGVRDSFLTDLHLFDLSGEQGPLLIRQEDEASFSSLIALMLTAQEEQEEESPEVISASLKLFLLMARKIQKKQQLLVASSLEDPSIIRSFKALVESHFQEWHKVHEYAGHLGITPNYLKDLVKSTLNASAKQYIQNRILLEAKRKVHFTDMNAKEIGFSLGFHDPAHFSKFFKQGTGMSLTAFKEEING
ncbi:MAG: helix-turn-helix transcriptional regulator [Bacteroidota bacterium]